MGLTKEFLGKQVRCPHCQTIQIAPFVDPPPSNNEVPREESFGQNNQSSNIEPETSELPFTQTSVESTTVPNEDAGTTQVLPFPSKSESAQQVPPFFAAANEVATEAKSEISFENNAFANASNAPLGAPWDNAPSVTGEAAKKRAPVSKSMAMPIIFFSLLSYSMMATAILVLVLFRVNATPKHPLEFIPDVDGDNPGAKRTKIRFNNDKERTLVPLPRHLKTKMGQVIRVGELEVTPLALEKTKVGVLVSGFSKPEPCKDDSLILKLKLKNVSADQSFSPLDYYFNRKWKEKTRNNYPPPFTMVQLGSENPEKSFFGGPAKWLPLALSGGKSSQSTRETVEGGNLNKSLDPGEDTTAFLCTDGDDEATQSIFNYKGPILWRIQVRRGLVEVGSKQIPASAVIGVEFSITDIKPLVEG